LHFSPRVSGIGVLPDIIEADFNDIPERLLDPIIEQGKDTFS